MNNVTSTRTCSISFKKPTIYEQILADKTTRYSGPREGSFNSIYQEDNTKTLYTSTENGTTIYYFAGNTLDNWVKFGKNSTGADLYWRIIRTNADGSIRLLYHSTSPTAEDAYISSSTAFDDLYNDSMYVGYMYGTSGTLESNRKNTNNSTIKSYIDTWYEKNLKTNYGKYLSETTVYCNDREVGSGSYSANGTVSFTYKGHTRVVTNKTPTYDCANINDKFTVSTNTGNGKLTYPIGLMTADEIVFAGGVYGKNAEAYYYRNSSSTSTSSTGSIRWWTMSPSYWSGSHSNIIYVLGSKYPGYLNYSFVNHTEGVRPVTSLKSCVQWKSGDGTPDNPYEIVETTSGC